MPVAHLTADRSISTCVDSIDQVLKIIVKQ